MASDDSNAKNLPEFLSEFLQHAKNLTDFERRHHRLDQPEGGQDLKVSSLTSLERKGEGQSRSAFRTKRDTEGQGVIKMFPRPTDKDS